MKSNLITITLVALMSAALVAGCGGEKKKAAPDNNIAKADAVTKTETVVKAEAETPKATPGPADAIKQVAQNYLGATKLFDLKTMVALSDGEAKALNEKALESHHNFPPELKEDLVNGYKSIVLEVTNVTIADCGSEAVCTFKATKDGHSKTSSFDLVKKDGAWLISKINRGT